MKALGLRLLFVLGLLLGVIAAVIVFFLALGRRGRAFHKSGTICNGQLTALDDVIGPRLAGPVRVRMSSSSQPENSPAHSILGMALEIGGDQDLPLASFESFLHAGDATQNTNITDYLANQFASVTPWVVRGAGIVWFRAIPVAQPAGTGTRVDRLDAAIAAGTATFTLEMRDGPGPDGALRARIAELKLTDRPGGDDAGFRISFVRTARGLSPTGCRNGIRVLAYPASQLGRRLRGA